MLTTCVSLEVPDFTYPVIAGNVRPVIYMTWNVLARVYPAVMWLAVGTYVHFIWESEVAEATLGLRIAVLGLIIQVILWTWAWCLLLPTDLFVFPLYCSDLWELFTGCGHVESSLVVILLSLNRLLNLVGSKTSHIYWFNSWPGIWKYWVESVWSLTLTLGFAFNLLK